MGEEKRMSDLPIEVKLVSDVRTCRTCKWFWGGTPPYGNFPVFDWNEDFPEEIRNQKQTLDYRPPPKPILKGEAVGQGQVDPGIMHGCRKAPIMTIGINPNLTAYYASDSGARWSYPNFSNDARYAYYYRHHNVYQESLDPDFIKDNIKSGTELIAEQDGWLLSTERSSDHRWVLLNIQYVGEDEPKQIEVAWTESLRFVIIAPRRFTTDLENLSFKKGEIIGGKIEGLKGDNVQVYENATGYYQRFVYVLESFKKMAGGALATADLSISEDVAQHDMIACASPGWSTAYDIPRDRITQNCVNDHGFLISQLVQSKPAVIVIVGGSSMAMFAAALSPFIKDLEYEIRSEASDGTIDTTMKETFQLLKETTEREHFLHIKTDDFELKSRLIISPHFSYRDNFRQHCRISASAWRGFELDFAEDVKVLEEEDRRQPNTWNDFVPVRIYGPDDDIKNKLSASGWNVLMAYYYDPINMMANALYQELNAGRIAYDENIGRLARADGSCRFCKNDEWEFPEGCPYGKLDEPIPPKGMLEKVSQEILQETKAAPLT